MPIITDEPQTESEIRAAKRVACIAESMDIIRTLNSNDILFTVGFNSDTIGFEIKATIMQVRHLIPVVENNGRVYSLGLNTGIAFAW